MRVFSDESLDRQQQVVGNIGSYILLVVRSIVISIKRQYRPTREIVVGPYLYVGMNVILASE